jgi:FKBP-type peptidyl-prolyl cis-trans isomerase
VRSAVEEVRADRGGFVGKMHSAGLEEVFASGRSGGHRGELYGTKWPFAFPYTAYPTMKLKNTLIASVLALGSLTASAQPPATPATPDAAPAAAPKFTPLQALEAYGWYIGKSNGLAELGFSQAEVDAIVKGMMIAREGKESPFDLKQIGPEVDTLLRGRQEVYMAKMKEKASAEAEKLMAEVKAKPGVVALPSGVVYEIVQPGTGAYPKATDIVKVHYTGKLVNGTTFDTSLEPRQPGAPVEPAEFPLNGVIPGWTEGLQKINVGGKIKLYIPPALGYGDNGTPSIPPGSLLIFDVELLDVKAPPAEPAAPDMPAAPAPDAVPTK